MHISQDNLSRKWNNRGKRLRRVLSKVSLVAVNLSPYGHVAKFPVYCTYLSNTGNSIVDCIFVESDIVKHVDLVQALKERPDNTAFHLPVTININLCSEMLETDRDYIRNYLKR